MKSKLDLAHEYYISKINAGDEIVTVKEAWAYADAMYEQHEKRSPPAKSIADIAREINQNIKEDGQKIADKQKALLDNARTLTKDENGNCMHFHHEFGHKKCMDCGASLKEWQPDWSVAPEGCDWWAMDRDGLSYFYNYKPYISDMSDYWGDSDLLNNDGIAHECDITNYTGHWRDSLRKRPK